MDTFGKAAEILGVDNLAGDVVDIDRGLACFTDGQLHSGTVDSWVGIEADCIVAIGDDSGDVEIYVGSDNFVGVVDNIGAVHEDTTSIGAEVHGFAPFGAGIDIEDFANTVVAYMFNHRIVVGDLVHAGDGNTAEVAILGPTGRSKAGGFEHTVFGSDIKLTLGVLDHGAESRNAGGKRDVADLVVVGRSIVNADHIGSVIVVAIKGKDDAIFACTRIDRDGRDTTAKQVVGTID